jgi:hypothetical protein
MEKNIPFKIISIPTARSNESSWTNTWHARHHWHVITLSHLKCYLLHTCNMEWVMAPPFISRACSWCHSDNMPLMVVFTSRTYTSLKPLTVWWLYTEVRKKMRQRGMVYCNDLTCQVFVLFLGVCLMDIYWWAASRQKPAHDSIELVVLTLLFFFYHSGYEM